MCETLIVEILRLHTKGFAGLREIGMIVGKLSRRFVGFTLIELLVTIAVAVILATIAIPSFRGMLASNRAVADYNFLISGLNFARSESIKRRNEVTFEVVDLSPWSFIVFVNEGGGSITLRVASGSGGISSSGKVVYNSLGRVSECTFDDCDIMMSFGGGVAGRTVSVNPAGSVSEVKESGLNDDLEQDESLGEVE